MTRAVDEDELIENWTLVGAELEPGRRAAWAGEAGMVLAGGLVVVPPVLGEGARAGSRWWPRQAGYRISEDFGCEPGSDFFKLPERTFRRAEEWPRR